MSPKLCLLKFAIAELFADASQSGSVSLADRYGLMAAVLESGQLTEEENCSIDRLLRLAARGKVTIVDELSTLSH